MIYYINDFNKNTKEDNEKILENLQKIYIDDNIKILKYNYFDSYLNILESLKSQIDENSCLFIGEGLGGFYANLLATEYKMQCILINPYIFPLNKLVNFIGKNENIETDEKFDFTLNSFYSYDHIIPSRELIPRIVFVSNDLYPNDKDLINSVFSEYADIVNISNESIINGDFDNFIKEKMRNVKNIKLDKVLTKN